MDRLTLPWAEKFRELVRSSDDPIRDFLKYSADKELEVELALKGRAFRQLLSDAYIVRLE